MLKAKVDGIYSLNKDGEERKISGPIEAAFFKVVVA